MGYMIAEGPRYSTWGKFRIALGRNTFQMPVLTEFSREWEHGLKVPGGYPGWAVKSPDVNEDFTAPRETDWQPVFYCTPEAFPGKGGDIYLSIYFGGSYVYTISEKLQAYLLDKDINTNDGSAPMRLEFWDAYSDPEVLGPNSTTVTSVEDLDNF